MGGGRQRTQYLINSRGNKAFTDEDKESIQGDLDRFRISDEKNLHFDRVNDRYVENFIDQNDHLVLPYDAIDLDRLDPGSYLTRPTTMREIKEIKGFKSCKAPRY